jgi:hypothetical protein
MATPEQRTPIRLGRGDKADLDIALADGDLLEGELVWARDLAQPFIVTDDNGDLVFTPAGGLSISDQAKLDGIEPGANNYSLPPATTTVLGGIKADGTTCQIDPDGTLHALGASSTPGSVSLVSGTAPITVTNGSTTPLIAVAAATTSAAGVVQLADSAAIAAGTAGRVVDAAQLLASGPVPSARTVTAGAGLDGGGALSGDIVLSVEFASQAQAEAGSATDVVMSPLRTAQAVAGKVSTSRSISAGSGLSGGGDLSADRSFAVAFSSQAQAEAGVDTATSCSPLRVHQAISARTVNDLTSTSTSNPLSAAQGKALNDNKVPNSRQVIAGTGLSGGGDLSASRTLSVSFASQVQAEAGSASDVVMSPLRTAQAVAGKVDTTRAINTAAGTGLIGGGTLGADRNLALTGQALALHQLGNNGLISRTGNGTVAARSITGSNGITVANGDGVSANPVISPTVASQAEAEAGVISTKLMTPERVAQAISALGPSTSVVLEVFTASGTFAKDPRDIAYWIEVIGGGGSGARSATSDPAGGGGGGGMVSRFMAASAIASTEAVTVGAGGGAVTALGGANGNAGGTSAFGLHLGVFGGRGGISTGNGGAGGGVFDPDAISLSGFAEGGFIGGASGQPSVYGGGGGNGGPSMFGGGGGGRSGGSGSSGGSSLLAGTGGAGGTTSSGQAGQVPGGGGGGTQTGSNSGAGGRGEVRIYRFQA